MFGFLKKTTAGELYAPATGELKAITEVEDPVFAEKMLGDGYAVKPINGQVTAPVSGIVSTVFPTKHAIGITTPMGDEVLVHIGIDTVELNGQAFTSFIEAGQKVTKDTVLVEVDLNMLQEHEKDATIIVVFTNGRSLVNTKISYNRSVANSELVGQIES